MNLNKIIIVQHNYESTTPKTQRMLAAAREYVKLGCEVVFVVSTEDSDFDKIPRVRFIKVKGNKKNVIKYFYNFYKAIKNEYDGSTLLLFYEIPLYAFLFGKKKYNTFAEITEIPFYGRKLSFLQKIIFSIRLFALRRFKGLFVISRALKNYYRELGVSNIEVINMYVDINRFDKIKKDNSEKYIAYCGRISYYKDGVNDLIVAFSKFVKQYPDFKLKLIGAFESEIVEDRLRKLVCKEGVANKVQFTGLINPQELPYVLKNATILALARPDNLQTKYGFPTKLGEYLATGNPVVVTKVGEIPLYLKDSENAYLAMPDNPESFAEKLILVYSDMKKSTEVGNRGHELTKSEFSSVIQTEKAYRFALKVLSD